MKTRIYYAETIETMIESLKTDYCNLMHKAMDDNDTEKVIRFNQAVVALGILEDRVLDLPLKEIEES